LFVSAEHQAQAVAELIHRKIGPRKSDFCVSVREEIGVADKDTFKVCASFSFTFYCLVEAK